MRKELVLRLWFTLKDNSNQVYFKKYHDNTIMEVDFDKSTFHFGWKIKIYDKEIQNISKLEDWVVFECVNRLLEKWYKSEDIILEKVYPTWHATSWRLDILVMKDDRAYLMIECKTWWSEFDKEFKNMQKNGWQLFTYFQQDRSAEFLVLYASNFDWNTIEYKNEIIKIEESYRDTSNVVDFYARWNKFTKQNGIFENWVNSYNFESKALTKKDLVKIKQVDSSIIFNRFLEILRHNTVSDKPNAFNKMFTLFLCKIHDEWTKWEDDELDFQFKEWIDNDITFQTRLTDLYKRGMFEFLKKEITDFNDDDFNNEFWEIDINVRNKILEKITKLRLQKNNEFAIKEVFDEETFLDNAKVLKEVVELLQVYQIRYAEKQPFLWDFFELLLTTWLKQESGQFFTPVPIARFICKSIPLNKIIESKLKDWDATDLLPTTIDYAAWSGHFLTESMEEIQKIVNNIDVNSLKPNVSKEIKKWKGATFDWALEYMYWIEKDYRLVKTAKVGCYLHGDWIATVIHWDGLDSFEFSKHYRLKLTHFNREDKQENAKFDLVLSNPPYSVSAFKWNLDTEKAKNDFDLFNWLSDKSSEIECLFIERTKQLLKEWGIASIILPSSILSNTWIYTKAREIILKNFDIISIVSFWSGTFMATGTNTVTLFMRKRNKYFAKNLEASINSFFTYLVDISLNNIENVISKYIDYVWGVSFDDYKSLCQNSPNQNIKNTELFKDYSSKLKLQKNGDLFKKIIEIEKEKILYFVLTYNQNVVLVKSWEKQAEKEFLGYKFSNSKWSEWIHSIRWWKTIDECTKLFDPNNFENETKINTYISDWFNGKFDREIHEELRKHITRIKLVDLLTFNRVEFEKNISTNVKKKIEIGKYPMVKLWEICEVKIWGTPDRWNYEYWENWNNNWVSISEMKWSIIFDTKEKINDLWVKKSNVKLIKKWTTLLSFKLSIWKTSIAWVDLYTNEAIAGLCLENEKIVLNKYLFDLFNSKYIDLEKWWFNAFWTSLNSTFLKNEVKIPLAPLEIQQKIVSEIEVIESSEKRTHWELEKLNSNIDQIMKKVKWEKFKIWNICETWSWGTPLSSNYKYYENWNIPWINSWEVKNGLINETTNFINEFWLKNSSARIFPVNTVLLAMYWATAGQVGILWIEASTNQAICWILPNENINSKFLYHYLKWQLNNLLDIRTGVARPNLSQDKIKEFEIIVPPLETQKQIISQIEKLEGEIAILENDLKQIPEKKKEILNKYL